MTEYDEPPAIDPWRRVADRRDRRRYELFMLAAPVFAQRGFRGTTLRALAHACHLSPAGLYHYFASKEELATHALRSPRAGWEQTYIDPNVDPLVQLRQMVDLSLAQLPIYMLSLRLLDEIGDAEAANLRASTFRDGEQMLARFVSAAAPSLQRSQAVELARHLIALLVGSAVSALDSSPAVIRARAVDLLRSQLVPEHVRETRFDEAMEPG